MISQMNMANEIKVPGVFSNKPLNKQKMKEELISEVPSCFNLYWFKLDVLVMS